MKTGALSAQTPQANPPGADLDTDHVDRPAQAMPAGEPWNAWAKGHERRACIEPLVVRPPGLEGAAGDVQDLRRLTLAQSQHSCHQPQTHPAWL